MSSPQERSFAAGSGAEDKRNDSDHGNGTLLAELWRARLELAAPSLEGSCSTN